MKTIQEKLCVPTIIAGFKTKFIVFTEEDLGDIYSNFCYNICFDFNLKVHFSK